MKMSPSKQRILEEAINLFSVKRYEATSIEQITSAVGIRKASLYSHFKSKQEILDTLLEEILDRYEAYSRSAKKVWTNLEQKCEKNAKCTAEDVFKAIKEQMEFLIHDEFFAKTRRFLTIEQFQNPQLAAIQNKSEYTDMMNFHKELIQFFVDNDIFIAVDKEIITYEFFSPIFVQFYHIQREPECEKEAMEIVEKHIKYFFELYSK